MRQIGRVSLAILVLVAPLGLAQGSAELVSKSPVELYGSVRTDTKGATLYHASFENGTFSGAIYNGTVVERHRHIQEGCGLNYEEEHVHLSAGAKDPRFIAFATKRDSFVMTTFAGDEIGVGNGPAGSGAPVAAYLGPNPYAYADLEDPRGPTQSYSLPAEARAFPIERFLTVPTGEFKAAAGGRAILEFGALSVNQGGMEKTYAADVEYTRPECPAGPGPIPLPSNPTMTTIKTIHLYFTSGVVEAQQS